MTGKRQRKRKRKSEKGKRDFESVGVTDAEVCEFQQLADLIGSFCSGGKQTGILMTEPSALCLRVLKAITANELLSLVCKTSTKNQS